MSVVQKLEEPLGLQDLHDLKLSKVKAAVPPSMYSSSDDLKVLLAKGLHVNERKTRWLCVNEENTIERIYIEACLHPDHIKAKDYFDLPIDNSRFPGGRCYNYYLNEFNASVRGEYLTPEISYTLNLVFKYEQQYSNVRSYYPLRYKIDGESKVFIIYPSTHLRQDGWFVVPLCQFRSSQHTTADFQFKFEKRATPLIVAGIEFQPYEEKVELQVFEEYKDIIKDASQSLFYTSLDELKHILSKGVHLNGYKEWFSLNEKGHCHMISMKDCLIPNEDSTPEYKSNPLSRFPAGLYQTKYKGFKIHVKTKLLSPSIAYTMNLVFQSSYPAKQLYVDLKYRLGDETTFTVDLANQVDEDQFHIRDRIYMAELYQFTSDGSVDVEVNFENSGTHIYGVEGILFKPLEKVVEDRASKVDKVKNIRTISDSESATDTRGFLIDKGQWWFAVDEHGKKFLKLSVRATYVEDRFQFYDDDLSFKALDINGCKEFRVQGEFKHVVASPETNYSVYLVYELRHDRSTFQAPMFVLNKGELGDPNGFVYLATPPNTPVINTPVIRPLDGNSYNPLNRLKRNSLPIQRSDGLMEVKLWGFEAYRVATTVSMSLVLKGKKDCSGLTICGIELKPI